MSEPIPKAQMVLVDKLYKTPEERAAHIWTQIQKHRDGSWSDWDMVCFCVEYLGMQAQALHDEEFLHYVMYTSRWVYAAHYSNSGRLYGKPDRDGARAETGPGRMGSDARPSPTSTTTEEKHDANPTGSTSVQGHQRRPSLLRKAHD